MLFVFPSLAQPRPHSRCSFECFVRACVCMCEREPRREEQGLVGSIFSTFVCLLFVHLFVLLFIFVCRNKNPSDQRITPSRNQDAKQK